MMNFTEFDQFLDKPGKASFLYNVIVDVHFLTKSQEAFMVISLTCLSILQEMNSGKK